MEYVEQHYRAFMAEVQEAVDTALQAGQYKTGMPAVIYLHTQLSFSIPLVFGRSDAIRKLEKLVFASIVACVLSYTHCKIIELVKDPAVKDRLRKALDAEEKNYDANDFPVSSAIINTVMGAERQAELVPVASVFALIQLAREVGYGPRRFTSEDATKDALARAMKIYKASLEAVSRKIDLAVSLFAPAN